MPRQCVTERLWFDDLSGCHAATGSAEAIAIVHACKDPCHRNAVGYGDKALPNTHPDYLWLERPHNLYLNLVDPPVPLFKLESFAAFFAFVDREIVERPVLIHCNKGESRAPSLTLLYMAKRLRMLPDDSYVSAAEAFRAKYTYLPGRGIATFLEQNWAHLGS